MQEKPKWGLPPTIGLPRKTIPATLGQSDREQTPDNQPLLTNPHPTDTTSDVSSPSNRKAGIIIPAFFQASTKILPCVISQCPPIGNVNNGVVCPKSRLATTGIFCSCGIELTI